MTWFYIHLIKSKAHNISPCLLLHERSRITAIEFRALIDSTHFRAKMWSSNNSFSSASQQGFINLPRANDSNEHDKPIMYTFV
uniref:Uncharacterized protein n=1 Tax=Strigamia maritima TaxID=126957 RepID=T1IKS3_STRMM